MSAQHNTQEIDLRGMPKLALGTQRIDVSVHLLGGQIIEGQSEAIGLVRQGYPIYASSAHRELTWIPLANIKYVALGSIRSGGLDEDPGDDTDDRKGLMGFRDGDNIQAYLSSLPSGSEGFTVRMRVPETEFVIPAVVSNSALLEIRFVDRWGVGLNQWMTAPRRRRTDQLGEQQASDATDGRSRIMQLASLYRDRLSQIKDADLSMGDIDSFARAVRLHVDRLLEEDQLTLTMAERTDLLENILLTAVGYGPLDHLLRDSSVSEIMVNGPDQVYVERNGMIQKVEDAKFDDENQLLETIRRMVAITGRHIDELSPMVDARLPDGSRINAIIRPASILGPSLTIRKFRDFVMDVDDLLREGSLSPAMADFLRACVVGRMNILVSGGTGAGKTTTLNVLSSYIPEVQRVITIEDAAELQIQHPHVISLEHRPPNVEGKGELTIRQLVRNSLRMRPDRIVVGEVRGGEALDMLQAMNTGHDGSMSTIHSNSARDALSRLETMVMMASIDLPYEAVRAQVASAINLLVHQARMPDGRRKIVQVAEVLGYDANGPIMRDIYVLGMGADLHLEYNATGYIPKLLDKAAFYGVQVPDRLFDPEFARFIPAGSESMMPVIKDPLLTDEGTKAAAPTVREVVVVPFSSDRQQPPPLPKALEQMYGNAGGSPAEQLAKQIVAASPGLHEEVRDLLSAAKQAMGGGAAVEGSAAEQVFVPLWNLPASEQPGRRNPRATRTNARRSVQSVIESLVVYLGLEARLSRAVMEAFNGLNVRIRAYADMARISPTTASRDLSRAAQAKLLVADRHPQLGVTYRANAFLLQAVAYGLNLQFGQDEAITADTILSKVFQAMERVQPPPAPRKAPAARKLAKVGATRRSARAAREVEPVAEPIEPAALAAEPAPEPVEAVAWPYTPVPDAEPLSTGEPEEPHGELLFDEPRAHVDDLEPVGLEMDDLEPVAVEPVDAGEPEAQPVSLETGTTGDTPEE